MQEGRKKAVLSLLTFAAIAYGAVCAFLFLAQRSLMYFPTPRLPPAGARGVALKSGGETVQLWVRAAEGPDALIYFGGNAEDVGGNFAGFAAAMPRRALYFVNYRGYGGSTGSPSEQALFDDALAAYEHVRARHPDIAVVGRSLGSAVAVHLARERPVARLVLVTPFDSIAKVAAGFYPLVPVRLLLRDKFDSASRIDGVSAPTLVVIAENDEVIPRLRTDALVAKFPAGQARVEVIPGATHNDIDPARYLELIAGFVSGS